jgi:hypothetical protein
LPSGAVTSATTKFQLPTIWSLKLVAGCATAAPADSASASKAAIGLNIMGSPVIALARTLSQNASRRDIELRLGCGLQ